MKFKITGKFKKGEEFHKFSKEISAETKNAAIKKIQSLLGSNYKCKKNLVKIKEVEEIK